MAYSTSFTFLFYFILFVGNTFLVRAQDPVVFEYTTDDGMPANEIYSMVIDQNGFLWIGSDAGISRFNSTNFINYTSNSQRTKSLTGLSLSATGKIYAYSFNGQLFCIEGDTLVELESWSGKILNLACDSFGNVWIATNDGVYICHEHTKSFSGPFYPDSVSSRIAVSVVPYNNHCYSMFESGVAKINATGIVEMIPIVQPLKRAIGEYMLSSDSEYPWIICKQDGEVLHYENGVYRLYKSDLLQKSLSKTKVTGVQSFGDKKLWIYTYDGLKIYDYEKNLINSFFEGVIISDVVFDCENNCWVSTLHQGIFRIPDLQSRVWIPSGSSKSNDSPLKLILHHDELYFYTARGDIGIMNTSNDEMKLLITEQTSNVQSIYFDSEDNVLWLFTNNHLYRYENNELKRLEPAFPPVKDMIRVANSMILATSRGTLAIDIGFPDSVRELDSGWARDIDYESHYGRLYVAGNNGLQVYSKTENSWRKMADLLDSNQVIAIDRNLGDSLLYAILFDGTVWSISTSMSLQKVFCLDKLSIPSDISVNHNKIYIATNIGLKIYDITTGLVTEFNRYDGLASDDVRSVVINENSIWIATGKGIQRLSIEKSMRHNNGKIFLKELYKNNERIFDYSGGIELAYNQSLGFILESSHYASHDAFTYAYRLLGIDSVWNYVAATDKKITIPSLPSGYFKLEIMFVDHHGKTSENIILLEGYVYPPFWQRWWFYVLIGLLGVVFAFVLFKYRLNILRQKQLAALKKIRLENEVRSARQIALKAQMNPHFIFNVLNSIKAFIYENDKKNAIAYLGDFSDLVRKILEMSARNQVNLSEELDAIESYIRLEKMMLQGEFIYTKEIADDVDLHAINIPPLIIQPFVENAFQHGLRHMNNIKKIGIKIYYSSNKQVLVIQVSDNGIGRKAAAKINETSSKNHRSFAVDTALKRIGLVNQSKMEETDGLIISDLMNEKNISCGTLITIKIHLND